MHDAENGANGARYTSYGGRTWSQDKIIKMWFL